MKIKKNNLKKLAAGTLILLQISMFTGCTTTLNEKSNYSEPNKQEVIYDVSIDSRNDESVSSNNQVEETKDQVIEIPKIEEPIVIDIPTETKEVSVINMPTEIEEVSDTEKNLFDILEKKEESLTNEDLNKKISEFYNEHMMEINDITNEEYHDIHIQYGSLVYQRLVSAGIDKNIILSELNNVLLEQQLPRCVSEEQWEEEFGNIVSVLSEQESMYDAYFCLAYLVHDEMCDLEHRYNDFHAITCDELEQSFQKKYNIN